MREIQNFRNSFTEAFSTKRQLRQCLPNEGNRMKEASKRKARQQRSRLNMFV